MSDCVKCPHCAASGLSLHDYESVMVLDSNLAVFTLVCPSCKSTIAAIRGIPRELRPLIRSAAREVGAGMGQEE